MEIWERINKLPISIQERVYPAIKNRVVVHRTGKNYHFRVVDDVLGVRFYRKPKN